MASCCDEDSDEISGSDTPQLDEQTALDRQQRDQLRGLFSGASQYLAAADKQGIFQKRLNLVCDSFRADAYGRDARLIVESLHCEGNVSETVSAVGFAIDDALGIQCIEDSSWRGDAFFANFHVRKRGILRQSGGQLLNDPRMRRELSGIRSVRVAACGEADHRIR